MRRAYGLSGSQFALKLGVSLDTLRSWEIGRNQPDTKNILKLADLAPPSLTWELLREAHVTPTRVKEWLRSLAQSPKPRRRSR